MTHLELTYATLHPGSWWMRLARAHDRLFSDRNKEALKHLVIRLSIAGFGVHLLLIFLGHAVPRPPAFISGLGGNYLTAISTPFNFILFYEVVTLIGVLYESTTKSIAYQFQIVSLIFIRDVFKDIAYSADMVTRHQMTWDALPLLIDMWSGFLMFLLVAIFHRVARRSVGHDAALGPTREVVRFIAQKKAVAFGLGILLAAMAAYNLALLGADFWQVLTTGHAAFPHPTKYYHDLFTVMIFTDVLVLVLSIVVSGAYESVFRNAAFVVSIVLIRFALTEGYPWGAPISILAMIFGICVLLVFNFHSRVAEANIGRNRGAAGPGASSV